MQEICTSGSVGGRLALVASRSTRPRFASGQATSGVQIRYIAYSSADVSTMSVLAHAQDASLHDRLGRWTVVDREAALPTVARRSAGDGPDGQSGKRCTRGCVPRVASARTPLRAWSSTAFPRKTSL
jgi:hypothetical protein